MGTPKSFKYLGPLRVLTLFRLGVLEILYDWGGVECARAVCLFISQQLLTIELSFKFV